MAKKAQILVEAVDMTKSALDSVERNLKSVNSAVGAVTRSMGGLVGAVGAVELGRMMIDNAMQAEQASHRLDAVLKATGHAAGIAKEELDDLADSLAGATQFDDEGIRNAQATLLKFGNVSGDVFREGLKLAADYAAFIGTDVPDAAQVIGKALSSPVEGIGALERQIGKLRPEQEAMIKNFMETGRVADAQGVVLDVLRGKIGGTAEIMNTGLTKATSDVKKAWDELLESMGRSGPVTTTTNTGLTLVSRTLAGIKDMVDTFNMETFRKVLTLDFSAKQAPGPNPELAGKARAARDADAERAWLERNARQQAELAKLSEDLSKKGEEKRLRDLEAGRALQKRWAEGDARDAEKLAESEMQRLGREWQQRRDEEARLARQVESDAEHWRRLADPTREMFQNLKQIADLVNSGALTPDEGEILTERISRDITKVQDGLDDVKNKGKDTVDELSQALAQWGKGFSRTMAGIVGDSSNAFDKIKASFSSLIEEIIAMQIDKRLTQPIIKAGSSLLDGIFDGSLISGGGIGGGMSGGGLLGGLGGIFNGSAGNAMDSIFSMGFATGGSFKVGGSGGTDSQYVGFKATPGEEVTVRTPGQQAGDGGGLQITQHIHVGGEVTHTDLARVAEATKRSTMAAVAEGRLRGGRFAAAMGT